MPPRNRLMRDEIRAAATRLFGVRGLGAVTLQEIADELGMSKAALYHYFPNKDALVTAIFEDWAREGADRIGAVVVLDEPASARLRRLIELHVLGLTRHLDLYRLGFRDEDQLPAEARAVFDKFKREVDGAVRAVVQDGVESGEFQPVDAKIAAFAAIGMCNWMYKWYRPDGSYQPPELAAMLARFTLGGLLRRNPDDARTADGAVDRAALIAELAADLQREVDVLRATQSPESKQGDQP
ncbi:TetR/AcrR family transcriptional regulator [Yinghuangia seranimata]|uniref:TetR/AcrR family transcriptional regulator n=1 Tax=Yinghuangia seranimata TaxID=408067 RepID=UPI00248CC5EF|nr:TetR/AcrR family transcriptional regulator [Yinghuangia seranimata]MDI2132657.1 TetR/AcrR family transcriptional regulator [Yinghuangia seranimata]